MGYFELIRCVRRYHRAYEDPLTLIIFRSYFLSWKDEGAGGRAILWTIFAASGIYLLYSGLGLGLSLRAQTLVSRVARMVATDELRTENRDDLSGPCWEFLQFSNVFW